MGRIFTCKEGNSNKMWAYEEMGDESVKVKWGRIGLNPQSKIHTFSTRHGRDEFIAEMRKGYAPQDEQQMKKDADAARALGTQYKVMRLEYVDNQNRLIKSYDPNQFVLVEVLNSWSKETHSFLLGRERTTAILKPHITDNVVRVTVDPNGKMDLATSVRDYLRKLAERVVEAVRNKFGQGQRKLMIEGITNDEPQLTTQEEDEVVASIQETMVDKAVIKKFCALGYRKLEL